MSISQDKLEEERIARQAAIKKVLAKKEEPLNWSANEVQQGATKADTKAEPKAERLFYGRKLFPWEAIVNGRPQQVRPQTRVEVEAMDEKALMENIKRQDEVHAAKVAAAIREQEREVADNKKRREHEDKTGKREYGKERFISLEEARRRGLLSSSGKDDGDNWSSPGNPQGIMCGGR